jgi:hypothetical protein
VAWRRPTEPARIEPPLWYRVYDPAAWDEPDRHEQSMIDGCPSMRPWPDELHDAHSRRRWHEAQYRYRQQNPALATQEFDDLVSGEWRARRAERGEAADGSMEP